MHDLRWIRENPEDFDRGLARRGLPACAAEILALDKEWRAAETRVQEAQARRNQAARQIGILSSQLRMAEEDESNQKPRGVQTENVALPSAHSASSLRRQRDRLLQDSAHDKETETSGAAAATRLRKEIDDRLASLPNLPAPEVPDGPDETANRELRRHADPPRFNFAPLAHEAIGEKLGLMDFPRAARLSGSRFVVLKGALARLERAIGQFMLDLHTGEFGYTEIAPPLLVRDDAAFGTGQLPKAAEDMFQTREGLWLIPTAEVPLTNLVAGEILDEAALPLRFTAWTPCFRSEAGAAGKDTRGMIRMHQFNKVELVSITTPEQSEAEHERMTACAEEVLKRLGLAYRVMLLSSGDMGFAARKTYDIEVWLPGQNTYREISSCSNCGAFQALRMRARYRPSEGRGTRPVHTLNGSGLAVGRTMIAIIENFQRHDGTVAIPSALQPYMGGQTVIAPDG
jgi:seryl-tRNA synthetase